MGKRGGRFRDPGAELVRSPEVWSLIAYPGPRPDRSRLGPSTLLAACGGFGGPGGPLVAHQKKRDVIRLASPAGELFDSRKDGGL